MTDARAVPDGYSCRNRGDGDALAPSTAQVVITRCCTDGTRAARYPDGLVRRVLEERGGWVFDGGTYNGLRPSWDIGTAAEDASIAKAVTMLRALGYTVEHPLAEPVTAPRGRSPAPPTDTPLPGGRCRLVRGALSGCAPPAVRRSSRKEARDGSWPGWSASTPAPPGPQVQRRPGSARPRAAAARAPPPCGARAAALPCLPRGRARAVAVRVPRCGAVSQGIAGACGSGESPLVSGRNRPWRAADPAAAMA